MRQGRRPASRGVVRRNVKLKALRELVGKDRAIVAVDLASQRQAAVVCDHDSVWQQARRTAFTQAQVASALAARPYDLRHSGITPSLNVGVPAPEVAKRAGHGVAVLLRVYAGCIDGHEQLWNQRIEEALADGGMA